MSNYGIKTIGVGGFGKCRVYYSEKFKRKVVEKTVGDNFIRARSATRAHLKTLMSSNENLLRKETIFMLMMKTAKLDCCVEILDVKTHPFRIIMEYCEGGDVRNILDKYDVPEVDKMYILSQFLEALQRIHKLGVIHGDLKCQNIFLANKYVRGKYESIKVKIGDFGLSEIGGNLVFGGTHGFMAPEVPSKGGSFESDIYSAGKVMLEIMTQLPVPLIQAINSTNIFSLKNKLPKFLNITQFYDLVIGCLNLDYKKRPSAASVFKIFHGILGIWLVDERTNKKILAKYRIGEIVPVDTHEHPLILSDGNTRNYKGNGWYCSICNNKKEYFFNNMLSFHCKKCEYDLCYKCILEHDYRVVNKKMENHAPKGKKVYVTQHEHGLFLSGKDDRYAGKDSHYSWICDICKVPSNEYVYSFHCKECGYDVCSKCFSKYFQVREKNCCCYIF